MTDIHHRIGVKSPSTDSFEHLWEVRLDALGDYLYTNDTEEVQS